MIPKRMGCTSTDLWASAQTMKAKRLKSPRAVTKVARPRRAEPLGPTALSRASGAKWVSLHPPVHSRPRARSGPGWGPSSGRWSPPSKGPDRPSDSVYYSSSAAQPEAAAEFSTFSLFCFGKHVYRQLTLNSARPNSPVGVKPATMRGCYKPAPSLHEAERAPQAADVSD